ncbi:MAG: hypothetical protein GY862_24830, partial [Gammaproteobacteria bacterium]|nr:hypothetical protein [Gammaproteobacteria bacterium]
MRNKESIEVTGGTVIIKELRVKDVRSLLKMFQDDTPKKDGDQPKSNENDLTLENMISEQWLDGKIK